MQQFEDIRVKNVFCLHSAKFCVPSLWNANFCSLTGVQGGARFSAHFLGSGQFGGNLVNFFFTAILLLLFPPLVSLCLHVAVVVVVAAVAVVAVAVVVVVVVVVVVLPPPPPNKLTDKY